MIILNFISLMGGLAMFLYGMRLMGNNLKEGYSGTLKVAMEKVTNNPIKALLLGAAVTAIIQSSTATIVITSGLVAAGVISLHQSLGIIVGANIGTTVTGQIVRLLDVKGNGSIALEFFKPSTLAPLALILGVAFIMFFSFKNHDTAGNIAVGFGILFSGLMSMTAAVSSFNVEALFTNLGENKILGYVIGATVAFILQSSSATIAILQAFSSSGGLTFNAIYVVITGIYLGDCVTTAIVCSIGAKEESKRVGIVNILFNLSETIVVLIVVAVLHKFGVLDAIWNKPMDSGDIANTNTTFNLCCAIVLMPMIGIYEKLAKKIVKDKPAPPFKYADKVAALNPSFFATPAFAFRGCYDGLKTMIDIAAVNINKALDLFASYDEAVVKEINEEEENLDTLTDKIDTYLVQLSSYVSSDLHISILDQYHKVVSEFERLGDQAVYIAENATALQKEKLTFSPEALAELEIVRDILNKTLDFTKQAFDKRDVDAAKEIEPLEEVMDDLLSSLHDNHLERLREGKCTVHGGIIFLNLMANIGKISDTCSNVGVATIARAIPGIGKDAHSYITSLHQGSDDSFNRSYRQAHDLYFARLAEIGVKGE